MFYQDYISFILFTYIHHHSILYLSYIHLTYTIIYTPTRALTNYIYTLYMSYKFLCIAVKLLLPLSIYYLFIIIYVIYVYIFQGTPEITLYYFKFFYLHICKRILLPTFVESCFVSDRLSSDVISHRPMRILHSLTSYTCLLRSHTYF